MAAITSPIPQIQQFNNQLLSVAPLPQEIAAAKEIFQRFAQISGNTDYQRLLDAARVLLELKEEQSELLLKVSKATSRVELLRQSVSKMTPVEYPELKQQCDELRKEIEDLREDTFPPEKPKEQNLEKLKWCNAMIERKNPNAWKTSLAVNATIAGFIGGFLTYVPRAMENTFKTLDQQVHNYSNLCDPNLEENEFCSLKQPLLMQVMMAMAIGTAGVALYHAIHKTRTRILVPLFQFGYQWALTNVSAPAKETPASLPSKSERPLLITERVAIRLDQVPLHSLHSSKQFAYDKLTEGKPPADPLDFSVHKLAAPLETLKCKAFKQPVQPILERSGFFSFPKSTAKEMHWTADFADPHLLGYVEGPLLAQEELLALEHPALLHLKAVFDLNSSIQPLKTHEAVLMVNVGRYGSLKGLYGNEFAAASLQTIEEKLEKFETPVFSNLFAIAAPQNPGAPGKPYKKQHLKELFTKACAAFTAIAERSETKGARAIVHTGNWGAGAFGGSPLASALCQILAARTAGVELSYYPLEEKEALAKAKRILANIERQAPDACIGDILITLANKAAEYGIVYGTGNGT